MKYLLCLTVIYLFHQVLYSQGATWINCDSAQTQVELTLCAKNKSTQADSELFKLEQNFLYKLLQWQLEAKENKDNESVRAFTRLKEVFAESQQRWIEYRNSYCQFLEAYYGGSSMPMEVYEWRARLTRERAEMFRNIREEHK